MTFIQTVLALIVTLGILVTIHEYGHYIVARKLGVKVLRFSVGFGKPIWSRYDRHGTEFAVAAIPLGGYVKMLDEREGPVPDDQLHQTFNRQTPGRRIAIASAGPIANFLFAIAAYWLLSVVGFTTVTPIIGDINEGSIAEQMGLQTGMEIRTIDGRNTPSWREVNMRLLERAGEHGQVVVGVLVDGQDRELVGDLAGWRLTDDAPHPVALFGLNPWRPQVPAILGELVPDGRAVAAGLRSGDKVLEVDGEPVTDWFQLVGLIQPAPEQTLSVVVERDGWPQTVQLTPASRRNEAGEVTGFIGAGVKPFTWPDEFLRETRYNPLAAVPRAVQETWSDTRLTLVAIQKMLTGLLSPTNLSGPITIARVAEASASSGFEDFIRFLAYLSVSLGILNLLPIPVLDGGHIVYYTIEAIRKKPLSERAQTLGLQIGMALILTLMVFALYNDLMRL